MNMDNHDKRIFRYLLLFTAVWLILLTAIPSIFYTVLPLDTIETVMWSHPLSMGNAKHPRSRHGWQGFSRSCSSIPTSACICSARR